MKVIHRIAGMLFRQVDISSLIFFRIAFGTVMLWEVFRYLDGSRIYRYWIDPTYHFTYPFFDWVRPWPGDGMFLHFYILGLLSALITVGLLYRLSTALFFLGFSYIFLLERAQYLNHFYLIGLMSFLMIFMPAHRAVSLDAMIRPEIRSATTPFWALSLMVGQIGIVYFFGGIAKINRDWLRGEPMRDWLSSRTDFPVIGSLFTEEWMVYLFSYGGLLVDLLAVPLLLWWRTRTVTFAFLVLFHLTNVRLFSIGIFPWFAIVATTLFFPPDWPRRLWSEAWQNPNRRGSIAWGGALAGSWLAAWFSEDLELVPLAIGSVAGALAVWAAVGSLPGLAPSHQEPIPVRTLHTAVTAGTSAEPRLTFLGRGQAVTLALFTLWFAVQVALPLRHYFIPGYVSWTEEGHNFSWHMKLRDKDRTSVTFSATDPSTGETWEIDARETLTRRQYRKMASRPHMIWQFARHLAKTLEAEGRPGVEIRVRAMAALNSRRRQLLIDPNVNLAHTPMRFGHNPWILPLN